MNYDNWKTTDPEWNTLGSADQTPDPVRRYIEGHLTVPLHEPSAAIGFAAGVDAVARTIEAAAAEVGGFQGSALLAYAAEIRAKVKYPQS